MLDEAFSFRSDELLLEGRLHRGDGHLAAVVLHPHPRYGGDMHNHVVTTVCDVFGDRGATTFRFNFRGTGESGGGYDGGVGEARDALSAIAVMRAIVPEAALVLAGYSFGAAMASRVAAGAGLAALILVSPPVAMGPLPQSPEGIRTLIISGEDDDVSPPELLTSATSPWCEVVSVPGDSHSWWPGVELLAEELIRFTGLLLTNKRP